MSAIPPVTAVDPEARSADPVAANVEALKALFPDAFTEGQIDFDVLRQLLGDAVDDGDEKYGLNWLGKRQARRLALTPSLGTLRPAPGDSVDWDRTRNLMIEGDNLEVLKLLQKSFHRAVKAIYIDPPYNTGRNIIYPNDYEDNLSAYLEMTGQSSGGLRLTSNPESGGRFHSTWLSMIYPRLLAAKTLLHDEGVLFCTIDENEHATLSLVLKDVFGEDNYEHAYVSIVHNPRGQQGRNISYVHESAIVVFKKDGRKYLADVAKDEVDSRNLRDSGTESDRTDARNCFYPFIVKQGGIVEVGMVPPNDFHPGAANVKRSDGTIEVWPMTDDGDEKKWRYARDSVGRILDKLEPKMGRNSVQIIFHKASGTMRSVWQNARYDSSEYGTKLVDNLIEGAGFTYPKSLWAVYDAVGLMTAEDKGAIVLDFFAGSGTTGHAVMAQNAADGGDRRYILVQLPEPLDPKNKDQKTAADFCDSSGKPRTIAELTKERLRRAGAKIKTDNPGTTADLGFRVYKLATSNLKTWAPSGDLEADLVSAIDNVVEGRSEDDLLVELLLKQGIDLTEPVETRTIAGRTVHAFGGGVLVVCLGVVTATDAESLADGIVDWIGTLSPPAPTTVFFKDSGFDDDQAKTNVAAILEQRLGDQLLKVRSV